MTDNFIDDMRKADREKARRDRAAALLLLFIIIPFALFWLGVAFIVMHFVVKYW